jgi:hypothetical protein
MVIPQSVKKQKRKIGDISVGEPVILGGIVTDEQVYCTCRQVSYGEMIACDNKVFCGIIYSLVRLNGFIWIAFSFKLLLLEFGFVPIVGKRLHSYKVL